MRILYFGTSVFAVPPLRALLASPHTVVAVVTQPNRPAGRGGKLTPPPVKTVAEEHGLPVLQPASCRAPEFLEAAAAYTPDLSVVAAYGQFLPDRLLTLPRLGSVNLHGSLLPRLRGAAPIQRAIWNGDDVTGVCLMWMVREMDAGDVIACAEEAIRPDDTAGTLTAKLADRAATLLLTWLPALESGSAPRTPQDPALVTFAPPIRKEDRQLDWTQPANQLWRQVRALAPTPTAQTTFRGQPMKIIDAAPAEAPFPAPAGEPGEIVVFPQRTGVLVATGAGVLEIRTLQPAGKRAMSGMEFLRGSRLICGERFGA